MNEQQIALVKDTVPVLRESGVALTSHFYQRMLTHNPELKNIFNQVHQQKGRQQRALANAVLAYAEHIDDPSALNAVVERIAHKHTSLGIRPEQYAIVGKHLLASIKEVLGEAASQELIDAWAIAYQQLADLFIQVESQLYQTAINDHQGWTGWRPFKIAKKVQESDEITSFYLTPCDQGTLPHYHPGQYISVRVFIPDTDLYQPRQYSLSIASNNEYLRISVKKQPALDKYPEGVVSNLLHEEYTEGSIIDVSTPYGDFFWDSDSTHPTVLLSGGVGITPMMAIADAINAANDTQKVYFIHSARSSNVHAFKTFTDNLPSPQFSVSYFYDNKTIADSDVQQGPLTLEDVLPSDYHNADFYVCGPEGFMQNYLPKLRQLGIDESRIHAEAFGSGGVE
ncbi:NO-inducible flavohemoprotein [Vibrio palustris]|uniref:Flavohemoprotein n=1 Tax=Vibrio palustris TaxID=1918946 RepID=A0A1R4B0Z5_9VIBR|nr:NO-inducible flavohemoprotein [Vibrio palustris]SJL82598.1 Flavohemoprotein [Vibrio palustris]